MLATLCYVVAICVGLLLAMRKALRDATRGLRNGPRPRITYAQPGDCDFVPLNRAEQRKHCRAFRRVVR